MQSQTPWWMEDVYKRQELTFDSIQELVSHICETLNVTWGIPSIVDKKAVPKVSILNKGASDGAKIITCLLYTSRCV